MSMTATGPNFLKTKVKPAPIVPLAADISATFRKAVAEPAYGFQKAQIWYVAAVSSPRLFFGSLLLADVVGINETCDSAAKDIRHGSGCGEGIEGLFVRQAAKAS